MDAGVRGIADDMKFQSETMLETSTQLAYCCTYEEDSSRMLERKHNEEPDHVCLSQDSTWMYFRTKET